MIEILAQWPVGADQLNEGGGVVGGAIGLSYNLICLVCGAVVLYLTFTTK